MNDVKIYVHVSGIASEELVSVNQTLIVSEHMCRQVAAETVQSLLKENGIEALSFSGWYRLADDSE